jgi:hypothetical protein
MCSAGDLISSLRGPSSTGRPSSAGQAAHYFSGICACGRRWRSTFSFSANGGSAELTRLRRGMKFDSAGITRRRDTKLFYPKTEKEVFDVLGLEYVEPRWRNADV